MAADTAMTTPVAVSAEEDDVLYCVYGLSTSSMFLPRMVAAPLRPA
ncbi:hypothetical protein [Nitrososphaera sp.]